MVVFLGAVGGHEGREISAGFAGGETPIFIQIFSGGRAGPW